MKYIKHWRGYKNGKQVDEVQGTFDTFKEAYNSILEWWELNYFEPPYVRLTKSDGCTTIDYGYHHCFYEIEEV